MPQQLGVETLGPSEVSLGASGSFAFLVSAAVAFSEGPAGVPCASSILAPNMYRNKGRTWQLWRSTASSCLWLAGCCRLLLSPTAREGAEQIQSCCSCHPDLPGGLSDVPTLRQAATVVHSWQGAAAGSDSGASLALAAACPVPLQHIVALLQAVSCRLGQWCKLPTVLMF